VPERVSKSLRRGCESGSHLLESAHGRHLLPMWRVVFAGFDREDPWAADPERPPLLCPSVCRRV